PAASLDLRRGDRTSSLDLTRLPMNMLPANLTGEAAAAHLTGAEQLHALLEVQRAERILPLGSESLDAALPHGGLVQGSIIELQVQGAGGAATSFALCACRAAQQASARAGAPALDAQRPWCAFIDPTASLFAPGVARLGVELDRLLVVRPEVDAIERVAVRIAE